MRPRSEGNIAQASERDRGRSPELGLLLLPLLLLGLGHIACQDQTPSPASETTRPPDVILITLDTTRADHLGIYGYPRGTSRWLDAFAREAVVYDRAWSTAPWTLPSHASMFTGRYPTSHGAHYNRESGEATLTGVLRFVPKDNFRVNRLPESEVTLAERLRDAGYATAAFAGGHWLAPGFGVLQGYDLVSAHVPKLEGRPAAELNAEAIAWLHTLSPEQPAHLMINYFDAHDPYTPADADRLPIETLDPDLPEEIAELVDAYDGEIRYMDRHVGELFQALKEAGRFENALILVVADHGELFGEHGQREHGPFLYEELVRIPYLIRFPGGRDGGTRSTLPVSLVDLFPIVAREVGLALPDGIEGRLPGESELIVAESRSSAFHVRKLGPEVDRDLRAAVVWPWKLLAGSDGSSALYDLAKDPHEQTPVDDAARAREIAEALARAAEAFTPPTDGTAPEAIPASTEEHLRALGYIE